MGPNTSIISKNFEIKGHHLLYPLSKELSDRAGDLPGVVGVGKELDDQILYLSAFLPNLVYKRVV
jgi:hypothetical protein